jgi:hypothetical protein
MTMLDPNGCPEHRGSRCEADQAPPSTHRPSGRAAGVAGKIQGRHQDCGDADRIVITGGGAVDLRAAADIAKATTIIRSR